MFTIQYFQPMQKPKNRYQKESIVYCCFLLAFTIYEHYTCACIYAIFIPYTKICGVGIQIAYSILI